MKPPTDQDTALDEIEESAPAPDANTVPFKPIAQRAQEWQESADAVVEDALLGAPVSILSVQLQPFTSARGSILRKAKNEFIAGVKISDIEDPFLSIGKFLLLMSVPLNEARKLVVDSDALEDKAYDLLDTINLRDIETVIEEINTYVSKEMSPQVHGKLPDNPNADKAGSGLAEPKN